MTRTLSTLLFLTMTCAACAPADDGAEPEATSAEAVRSGTLGAYTSATTRTGDLVTLSLNADGSYQGTRSVVCIQAPCYPAPESGYYRIYTRYGAQLMDLLNGEGAVSETYQIWPWGNDLYIRRTTEATWQRLERATAPRP